MKSFFCPIALLLVHFYGNAREISAFTTCFEETVHSKIPEQERKVWIHNPKSNGGNKIKDKGNCPASYLLDGGENFNTVVSITEHMAESSLCPPMIMVGILLKQSKWINTWY